MSQRNLFPKDGLPKSLRTDFEAFWNAYPVRSPNPRALAETAYARAVAAGAIPADLVRAADAYAAEVRQRGIGQEFVVHAATFLRQRRHEDYLRAPIAEAPRRTASTDEIDHPLWHRVRDQVSEGDFRRWLQPLRCVSLVEGSRAVLQAPSRFHRDWVRLHYAVPLKGALRVRILDIDIAEDIRA